MKGISAHRKCQRTSPPVSVKAYSLRIQEVSCLHPRRGFSPEPNNAGRTVRNKFLVLIRNIVYGILL